MVVGGSEGSPELPPSDCRGRGNGVGFICIGVSLSLRVSAGNGIGFICMGVSLSLRVSAFTNGGGGGNGVSISSKCNKLINPSTSVLRKSRR